jgi:cephalosporin hydroxylase
MVAAAAHGPRTALLAARAKRKGAKQKTREFAGLLKLVRQQRPRIVLEIGTYKGGSLWAWCHIAAADALIVSIDLPGGDFGGGFPEAEMERLQTYARRSQTLHLVRADSHSSDTLAKVRWLLNGRAVDFAFIDGDHTYEGVRRDFEMYGPLVQGLVAFHDTLPHDSASCEVDRLWTELRPDYETVEFTDPADVKWDGGWGGIGVLRC